MLKRKGVSAMKIRQTLELFYGKKLSRREISNALNISRRQIGRYLDKFNATGILYEEIIKLCDDDIIAYFKDKKNHLESDQFKKLQKQLPQLEIELKGKGVTLQLLWEEYTLKNPDGYCYSHFCHHYKKWRSYLDIYMHIEHKPGDKMYVDYAGHKFKITNMLTGEEKDAEIFVAILGLSELVYVESTLTQQSPDWISSNINALTYFGGSPNAIVPDCTKTAVKIACKYDPEINGAYNNFAKHYDVCILPARPYSPKDKALVENAVNNVYRRIMAPLRNRTFYTLEELNEAIQEKLEEFNNRPMQKLKVSRRKLFEQREKAHLKLLPAVPYELKSFQHNTKVQFNYHVELKEDMHYYSVPYKYKGERVAIIYTDKNVEIFHNTTLRIAFHRRDKEKNGYSTEPEHMPSEHRFIAEWNPERIKDWAFKKGEHVKVVVEKILSKPMYPEQAFKKCIGIISLGKKYTDPRLEKACIRAITHEAYSYRAIKNILNKGWDKIQDEQLTFETLPIHENIRGSNYYCQNNDYFKNQEKTASVEAL